jgi:hypothetical protein
MTNRFDFAKSVHAAATFTTIDVPGAGAGPDQGTVASSINTAGVITGYYSDASRVYHGFVYNTTHPAR